MSAPLRSQPPVVSNQLFGQGDAVLSESLNHRLVRQNVITSNVANSQTPGFRALGYAFEEQLQAAIGNAGDLAVKTSEGRHFKHPGSDKDGNIKPDVFVKPTESIGNDGNTVDVDQEMADLAANQILYKATIELLNRRMATLRYGINGGRG